MTDCTHLKPVGKMSRSERGKKMHKYICCKHPTMKFCKKSNKKQE